MLDPTQIDSDPEGNEALVDPPHHGGGPNTPSGKSRSSKNSVTHGCRSNILILDDEDPAELEALYDRWRDAYQPDTEAAVELLEQLVLNKWYLLRNERRFNEVEFQLSFAAYTKWNEQQHKIYQLTHRYKTAADRSVSKAQRDLEDFLKNRRLDEKHAQHLKDQTQATYKETEEGLLHREQSLEEKIKEAKCMGIDISAEQAELGQAKKQNRATLAAMRQNIAALNAPKTRAQILFQGQNSPKKLRRIPLLDQWVEIKIKDGVTVTELTPSNEQLIERGQTMDPPPELVYRRLCFQNGVPEEYHWTTDDPVMREFGGLGTQRMSVDTWLDLIDAEKLQPGGHIGPSGDALARPREHGSCHCPACEENRERLQQRLNPTPKPEPGSSPHNPGAPA